MCWKSFVNDIVDELHSLKYFPYFLSLFSRGRVFHAFCHFHFTSTYNTRGSPTPRHTPPKARRRKREKPVQ
ncbi:hypothetical protein VTN00DRAFT_5474 [Thermoascus crustaceus]|uniref:uncharacterized protein n=1 Tax=Thermoascus crustaceus TaxID=5088 RepID=UPI003744AFB0